MAAPPLYNSIDDVNQPKCVFCGRNNIDIVSLGDKYTYNEITFHTFCIVSVFIFYIDFSSRISSAWMWFVWENVE